MKPLEETKYQKVRLKYLFYDTSRGTLNTAFFDIFTMNKAAKKMNMLL